MTRLVWMILSATLCLAGFAFALFVSSPAGAEYAPAWMPGSVLTVAVLAALGAAGLAFVLMLMVPACVDGFDTGRARRRLHAFKQAQLDENVDTVNLLTALVRIPWLARRTESYFGLVGLIDPRSHSFSRTAFGMVPAEPYLGPDTTVDRRLGVSFFRGFPLLFFGLGIAGVLARLQESSGPVTIEPLDALPALILVTVFALIARLALDLLIALRRRQAEQFCREVESLAHRELPDPLGDLATTLNGSVIAIRDRLTLTMDALLDRQQNQGGASPGVLGEKANATLALLAEAVESSQQQLHASAGATTQINQTWHQIAEVLVPTIERLVDLHAHLGRLVDGTERSDIRHATEQLASLAKDHRDTLDAMMQVAQQMREVADARLGSSSEARHEDGLGRLPMPPLGGGARAGAAAPSRGLARDLDDLRKELASMADDLPPLGGSHPRDRPSDR